MKLSLILVTLSLAVTGSLRAAAVLTIVPSTQTVGAGSTAQVQVRISGLGQFMSPSLGAFDFNLAFDPSILAFSSITFGDPVLGDQLDLSGLGAINDFSLQSAGHLEFFEISLDPSAALDSLQKSSFALATLRLQAIGIGTTSLVSSLNSVSDSQGASFGLTLATGSITVVPTPEPGTLGLLVFAATWCSLRGASSKCALYLSGRVNR